MGDSSSMDDSFLKPHAHAGRFHLAVTWLESLPLPPSSKGTAPTTLAGWEMVEQWRVLITCIESQGQFERERLRVETAEWKKRAESVRVAYETMSLQEAVDLDNLVQIHSQLPVPLPPASRSAAIAKDPTPAFVATTQSLEDRVLSLELELQEAQNLHQSLKGNLSRTEEINRVMNANAKDPASDLSLAKVLQAHDLLDRKTEEYKARLLARQYRAQQYLATGEGHAPNLELLQAHTDSFADISARAQDLRIKLAAFDELPSNLGSARAKLAEQKLEIAALRKSRDKLLDEIGGAVH